MKKTLGNYTSLYLLLLFGLLFLIGVTNILFPILYFVTGLSFLLFLSLGLSCFFLLGYVILSLVYYKRMKEIFVEGLYYTTKKNLSHLAKSEYVFDSYPDDITEFHDFNQSLDKVSSIAKHIKVESTTLDYSSIGIEYVDEKKKLVETTFFHSEMKKILSVSSSYRNGLVDMYYILPNGEVLTEEEREVMLTLLEKTFETYPGHLFCYNTNHRGIYVYLPILDSFEDVKERLSTLGRKSSLTRMNEEGETIFIQARFALVCYPYSMADEMFSDIIYARHMPNVYNLYLPDRLTPLEDNKFIASNSMHLNFMTKMLHYALSFSPREEEDSLREKIRGLFISLCHFLHIDSFFLVKMDDNEKFYRIYLSSEKNPKEGSADLKNEFIPLAEEILDEDGTYYASSRNHVSYEIGGYLDKFSYSSCFFNTVKDKGRIYGIACLMNHKDLPLDSYLRESLLMVTSIILNRLLQSKEERIEDEHRRVDESILKLTNYGVYSIRDDYTIFNLSDTLLEKGKNIRPGMLCYQALYGLSSPCKDCPRHTGRMMTSTLFGRECTTSLSLTNGKGSRRIVLLVKEKEGREEDVYDQGLFINNYNELYKQLSDAYLIVGKGYLLILKFDNIRSLLSKYGSEKYLMAERGLIDHIKEYERINNVFAFKSDAIVILLRDYGTTDLINDVEAIENINSRSYFPDSQDRFHITYLPVSYPQGYPQPSDLLRHAEDFYAHGNYTQNQGCLYFENNEYSRPASKEKYILSLIEEKSKNNQFNINFQPILQAKDKRIVAAEVLLRLSDDYRKIVLDTKEVIQVATENGKISLITHSLLNNVADLYKNNSTTFKMMGFAHIALNVDISYLNEDTFLSSVDNLIQLLHLEKDFFGFEINEKEIYTHYEEFKVLSKKLTADNIELVCDQYTGEYLSFETMKELGIRIFKIDRQFTSHIDTDRSKYTAVKEMVEESNRFGLRCSFLGVENVQQYKLIQDMAPNSIVQGYAFYRPLDKNTLINAIRSNNSVLPPQKRK